MTGDGTTASPVRKSRANWWNARYHARSTALALCCLALAFGAVLLDHPPRAAQGNPAVPISASSGFDFDSDGVDDLLIARVAPLGPTNGMGSVLVISGATHATIHTLASEECGDLFGASVHSAGDVDSDGVSDIVVGAPWARSGSTVHGRVHLFSGASGGRLLVIEGPEWSNFGGRVAPGGDVDGDGRLDVLVSGMRLERLDPEGPERAFGEVYAHDTVDGSLVCVFLGTHPDDGFGAGLNTIGDVNGDGRSDTVIASPRRANPGGAEGAVEMFFGAEFGAEGVSAVVQVPDVTHLNARAELVEFGAFLTPALDLDDDGLTDLLVFAGATSPTGAPAMDVTVLRAPTLAPHAHVTLEEVHPIGDVNASLDVDATDLSQALGDIGEPQPIDQDFTADLNGDGMVDANDIALLLASYGQVSEISDLILEPSAAALTSPLFFLQICGSLNEQAPEHLLRLCCETTTLTILGADGADLCESIRDGGGNGGGDDGDTPEPGNGYTNDTPTGFGPPIGGGPEYIVGTPSVNLGPEITPDPAARSSRSRQRATDELGRHGPGETTCDPVLLASGIKSERELDLYVPLPGRDFRLDRTYSGYTLSAGRDVIPSVFSVGWSTSADGWVVLERPSVPEGWETEVNSHDTFDPWTPRIQVVRFPVEESTVYYQDESDPNLFKPVVPSITSIRADVVYPGGGEGIPVWVHDRPGGGQTVYYRTYGHETLHAMDRRIRMEIDEFGNPWVYRYVRFRDQYGLLGTPRMSEILLGSENRATALAVIQFEWIVGTSANPGMGLLREARVVRKTAGREIVTDYARYTYGGDDEEYNHCGAGQFGLVLVETGTLTNAPEQGETPPTTLEYHTRFTHYRYGSPSGTSSGGLYLLYYPDAVEQYAEAWADLTGAGVSQADRMRHAARALARDQGIQPLDPDGSIRSTDLASKTILYYDDTSSSLGYPAGSLTGMVRSEFIRDGCACTGGALSGKQIDFLYSRRQVLDHRIVYPLEEGNTAEFSIGRWSRLVERTESTVQDGLVQPLRRIRTWSEDRLFGFGWGVATAPEDQIKHYYAAYLSAPFTIANEVAELDETGALGRRWATYHHFEGSERKRFYQADAVESLVTDDDGLLVYNAPAVPGVANPSNPSEAVVFKAGGLVETYEHDEHGRLIQEGVARCDAAGEIIVGPIPVTEREYLTSDAFGDGRPDLVALERRLTDNSGESTEPSELRTYEYELDIRTHLRRRAIALAGVSERREAPEQGGDGGSVVESWTGYSTRGEPQWTCAPDGSVTLIERDPLTGAETGVHRNVRWSDLPVPRPPQTNGIADRFEDGGSRSTSFVRDVVGRSLRTLDERGVAEETSFSHEQIEAIVPNADGEHEWRLTRIPRFCVESRPHWWYATVADRAFGGPVVRRWATSEYNILRESRFNPYSSPDPNAYTETARTAYAYSRGGTVVETRAWHDLAGDRFASTRYEHDPLGRLIRTVDPVGGVTETTYDIFDRPLELRAGVESPSGDEVVVIERRFYDSESAPSDPDPVSGVGLGNLSRVQRFVNDTETRNTHYVYDWRGRLRATYDADESGDLVPNAAFEALILDNLGRPAQRTWIGGGELASLLASGALADDALSQFTGLGLSIERVEETAYSPRGLPYESRLRVFPDGSNGPSADFVTRRWFDDAGRLLVEAPPDGPVTRTEFDGLGRVTRSLVTDGAAARAGFDSGFGAVTSCASPTDAVLVRTVQTYDHRGRPALVATSRRAHDAPDGPGIGDHPITTYAAVVFDEAARPIATVNYGAEGVDVLSADRPFATGGAPPTLPVAVPARTPGVIVSETRYDGSGRAFESVDPLGRITRTIFDNLDRPLAVVENAGSASIALEKAPDGYWTVTGRSTGATPDADRVTSMTYDDAGNVAARIAHIPTPGGERRQVTQYIYDGALATPSGHAGLDSRPPSRHRLVEVRYPQDGDEPADGLPGTDERDIVRFSHNRLGEVVATLDQERILLTRTLDAMGRQVSERVEDLTTFVRQHPIDLSLESIDSEFDNLGRLHALRSVRRGAGGAAANEITFHRDAIGRTESIDWSPFGEATSGGAAAIHFGYGPLAQGEGSRDRLTSLTYPSPSGVSGEVNILFGESGSLDDRIARRTGVSGYALVGGATSQFAASHEYVGVDRRVRSEFSIGGASLVRDRTIDPVTRQRSSGVYAGLDRFGRVNRHVWSIGDHGASLDRPALADVDYDYDAAGNILARSDARGGATPESRDEHHRFDALNRLIESARGSSLATPLAGSESWTLDHNGNWTTQGRSTSGVVYDDLEARAHNATNEIRNLTPTADGFTHTYDQTGRLIAQRLPDRTLDDGVTVQQRRRVFVHDGWGRLSRVSIERRNAGASEWVHHQTLAGYSYYAGHQRATRTARREAPGAAGDDDPPTPDLPEIRTHYIYDDAWSLLEERVEPNYDAREFPAWGWWGPETPGDQSSASFAHQPPAPSALAVRQFLWDPTASDELLLVRESAAPGSPAFDRAFLAVTDRRHDVVALAPVKLDAAGGGGAGSWSIDAAGVRRVRYSPYGSPEPIVPGDLDADGDADEGDLAALATLADAFGAAGTRPPDTGWRADADLDCSGVIDATDVAILVAQQSEAASQPGGSGGSGGGATASASLHLWPNSGSFLDLDDGSDENGGGGGDPPSDPPTSSAPFPGGAIPVGFGAMLYDGHTRLWLARLRWYDPAEGRWLTRDPAGYIDGLNLYQYVRGNPLVYFDPFGLYGCAEYWSDTLRGLGFLGDVGVGVAENVGEMALDTANLVEDVALGAGNTLGLVSDETFLSESETIVGLGASIEARGVGGTIVAAGEAAVGAVVDTVAGVAAMNPDAVADAVTGVGSIVVGTKGLDKIGKIAKAGKIADGGAATSSQAVTPNPARLVDQLVRQAQDKYPKLAGQIHDHHVAPKYLGGDPNGPKVPIDAAYHQEITNAFRAEWSYGGAQPSAAELGAIMQRVYERLPLP